MASGNFVPSAARPKIILFYVYVGRVFFPDYGFWIEPGLKEPINKSVPFCLFDKIVLTFFKFSLSLSK